MMVLMAITGFLTMIDGYDGYYDYYGYSGVLCKSAIVLGSNGVSGCSEISLRYRLDPLTDR